MCVLFSQRSLSSENYNLSGLRVLSQFWLTRESLSQLAQKGWNHEYHWLFEDGKSQFFTFQRAAKIQDQRLSLKAQLNLVFCVASSPYSFVFCLSVFFSFSLMIWNQNLSLLFSLLKQDNFVIKSKERLILNNRRLLIKIILLGLGGKLQELRSLLCTWPFTALLKASK